MTYEEKTYCVSIWRAMDNVFAAVEIFFQAQRKCMGQMKIAKAHGYQKILAVHLQKDFKRKLWRAFWAQPLPLQQNHYSI